ncbi:MAG: MmgE/PrpD family protein, partial [Candidatus Bipolaricaulota bacterium]
MSHLEGLIDFVLETRWEDLPEKVGGLAEMIKIDDFGSLFSGKDVKSSQIAGEYAVEAWGSGNSRIFATGEQCRPEGAAFANGIATNALDLDDCGLFTKGHPGCQIFPTVLALGEELEISGEEFLESLLVGYELAARVARVWHDYYEVYRAGGSWGAVAAAGVSARLMGLSPAETLEALRIAEYNSPYIPIERGVKDPTMVKHGAGYGPVGGITAARLARKGFTGTETILSLDRYGGGRIRPGQRSQPGS